MSRIYMVRHGQAGTRQVYDALSDLGRRQARLLGDYFVNQDIRFTKALSGSLQRQRQTAAEVACANCEIPEITVDAGWDEFDLDHVYNELAPLLCEEDPDFRREFEALNADVAAAGDEHGATVHRRWSPCDLKVVQAWIGGHPKFRGETWLAFRERIKAAAARLKHVVNEGGNIVVFTSATPIGICAALSLDIEDERALRLAAVLHNASYSILDFRAGQLRLHSFNAIPHLTEPELCTHR
jgi:broad specificity phosphatase PhoE